MGNISGDVDPEFTFWLSDGRVIRNLSELSQSARAMTEETYNFHANSQKNDFADWVRDIIKDQQLAFQVRKAKNPKELDQAIGKRLNELAPKAEAAKHLLQEPKIVQRPIGTEKKLPMIPQKQQSTLSKPIVQKPIQLRPEAASHQERLWQIGQREAELMEKERKLAEDETRVNEARVELTRKRYELLKERGSFDKEKFELFISEKNLELPDMPEAPKIEIKASTDRIEMMIYDARKLLGAGNLDQALSKLAEVELLIHKSPIETSKKQLKYKAMELEADIKLARLKAIEAH